MFAVQHGTAHCTGRMCWSAPWSPTMRRRSPPQVHDHAHVCTPTIAEGLDDFLHVPL